MFSGVPKGTWASLECLDAPESLGGIRRLWSKDGHYRAETDLLMFSGRSGSTIVYLEFENLHKTVTTPE